MPSKHCLVCVNNDWYKKRMGIALTDEVSKRNGLYDQENRELRYIDEVHYVPEDYLQR